MPAQKRKGHGHTKAVGLYPKKKQDGMTIGVRLQKANALPLAFAVRGRRIKRNQKGS